MDGVGSGLSANALDTWQVEGEIVAVPPAISFTGGQKGETKKGSAAKDKLVGGNNNDILKGLGSNNMLRGKGGQAQFKGASGNDKLFGDAGHDRLMGDAGNDRVDGGTENDQLTGGEDTDTLLAGSGNDVLIGGTGSDLLTGGTHQDLFRFDSLSERGDRITDFNTAEDLLDLRVLFAGAGFGGSTPYSRFDQYIDLVQVGGSTEVRVDEDGSGVSTNFVTLVTLENVNSAMLSSRQFLII